jgi:hypothetical protein
VSVSAGIAQQGYKVELARMPACMVYPHGNTFQFLRHELRWTIGLRNVRPLGHAAIGLTFGLPWTVLAVVAVPSIVLASLYVLAYLVLRSAVYLTIGVWGAAGPRGAAKVGGWLRCGMPQVWPSAVWIASFFPTAFAGEDLSFE